MKEDYLQRINELMNECQDMALLDLILKILEKENLNEQ